ncbi:hypothetical protein M0R88_06020 [Halorussus gelatinilyticus]|uniref:Uncharacterized protein n=1 Tax=Halorussus gelatinilyticus TaxID=2937524 RepID=A0A8U0INA0_9EURY|nr:hypothetical protein [Halorussus gelatinilyticus]UPW01654.1 hypothetical protein M0R88_06020 [Halorussus gelatinilyticus]
MKTTNTRRPTHDQYARAMTWMENCKWDFDADGGVRDRDEWRRDVFFGAVAEQVASDWLEGHDVVHRRVTDDEDASCDIDAYGVSIDVKLRYGERFSNPDLLVRERGDGVGADIYLLVEARQVDADGPPEFGVVGLATADKVDREGRPFRHGAHDKTLVDRDALRDPRGFGVFDAIMDVKHSQNAAS